MDGSGSGAAGGGGGGGSRFRRIPRQSFAHLKLDPMVSVFKKKKKTVKVIVNYLLQCELVN